ncbi:calponin homology domain-containing protein DDB_G0272472 isoform X2 [Drosophila eugracilis]|uniref:calponin homology domain-containing protein DDB_G0272472 isoform X2 n=1 Tax=Drosophila eugracilis TaxID=29029 RepID=UPI001BD9AE6E|nr:calponin homology domain-containing protein DDB_G0272472 isoform X2 [Drosophila eugracilis]
MSLLKRREKPIKESRWDRIRKRHQQVNALGLKTDAVRRLIGADYIGRRQEKLLIEGEDTKQLNPSVIMDMRHKMIPHKLPLATIAHDHSHSLEATKAHNLEVEQRFIDNQLQKFRQQLSRQFQRSKYHRVPPTKPDFKLNNAPLVKSLAQAAQHIDNFYNTPVQALGQMAQMCSETKSAATKSLIQQLRPEPDKEADMDCEWTEKEAQVMELPAFLEEQVISFDALEYRNFTKQVQADESKAKLLRCRTPSPLTSTEEFFRPMRAAAERQMLHVRTVRHEEELQLENQHEQPDGNPSPLKRESSTCSNTSDGIDSVISDLAEEALYELQLEAAEEQNKELPIPPKHVQFQLPQKKTPTPSTHPIGESEIEPEPEPLLIRRIELPKVVVKPREPEPQELSSDCEDESDIAQTQEKQKIIDQLFQARAKTQIVIMRKYFLKWIHFTTMEKIEREQGQKCQARDNRVQKINAFLDKVRQEKKRQRIEPDTDTSKINQKSLEHREEAVKMTKQFKNKIKVQQDIIDLQRIKLERQERLIMQLKLTKLSDEAKEAREDLKQELKTVIRCGDPKAKAKAKCLQLIGSLRDADDEEMARLQGKALLQPRFLQHMQERATERSVRHEQARQRRAQADAEREAAKVALEQAKRQEDEEAKRLRIEVLKEKRRQEKMAKILKERERQRFIENHRKAVDFSRMLLLRRIGMEGFKRLLHRKRENLVKSEEFRCQLFKKNAFNSWHSYTAYRQREKMIRAERCWHAILKRRALFTWIVYVQNEKSKMLVAIDWHALHAMEYWFRRWHKYSTCCRMIEDTKTRQAISHHEWHLKWKVLDCWRRLPQILKIEKETEERRQRWRMKIWELLPDYKPREDSLW